MKLYQRPYRIITNREKPGKPGPGFSLIELMIVVSIIMIMAAIFPPLLMNVIDGVKLRSSANSLSGLIQQARIQAVKANTYYPIQQTMFAGGEVAYYVDLLRTSTYASGDPIAEMASNITAHAGSGSGAPGESGFITSLNFTPDSSGVLRFNARGLPCVMNGAPCQTLGNGFVYFLSRVSLVGTSWRAVTVTPSGRVQVWSYDGTHWVLQ
jgi:prepilin-type N-terminal cleavage/methylation domain-containing protein